MTLLLRFFFSAIGLLVASALLKGITTGSFLDLLVVAVLLGALNTTVGSLLKALAFLPVACSFGCFSLVINGLVFWLAGTLSANLGLGFRVEGFWPGFFGALVTSVVASVLGAIFITKDRSRPEPPRPIKIIN
ncbi:MAG: phage holin family protein [Holophagaceae bacterium]